MSRTRWQHLDRHKPARRSETSVPTPPDSAPTSVPLSLSEEAPAWLLAARAQYRLGAFADCAQTLIAALTHHEAPPGARRLLGLAHAQLGENALAAPALHLALAETPDDDDLHACLWSVELEAGLLPEDSPPNTALLQELGAARRWLRGQQLALSRRWSEAARSFGQAAQEFAAHSPTQVLPERLAACYVGQGISYLLAGQPEAAQASYGRLPAQAQSLGTASPIARFASELYAVAEAVLELPPAERAEAVAPLAELLATVRMRVRFLDPDQSGEVALRWDFRQ